MKKFILIIGTICVLCGCASNEEILSGMRNQSDRELCMDYMTLPSMNFQHSHRAHVIKERRLDCWKFGNVNQERDNADERFQKGLDRLARPQQQYPTSNGISCHYTRDVISGMNKICYYNCVGSAHAVTVGAANICPLTTTR